MIAAGSLALMLISYVKALLAQVLTALLFSSYLLSYPFSWS